MSEQIVFEVSWSGPGWYGSRSERDSIGEIIRFYRVSTDAGRDDPFRAGDDAWRAGLGTPDWFDSEEEANAA